MREIGNLLDTPDLDPPMGDLFSFRTLSECRSVWTDPLKAEKGAPPKRIIHTRAFTPTGKATIERIGYRNAPGYHKCGSHQEDDWIVDLRILNLDTPNSDWREVAYLRGLKPQAPDRVQWIEMDQLTSYGLLLEIRRCGIDGWWTPWNLAEEGFVVRGSLQEPPAPRNEDLIERESVSLRNLPKGLVAIESDGQVRYYSRFLEIGFCLGRTGMTHLGIDQEGHGKTSKSLLVTGPGSYHQGLMLSPLGSIPVADPAVRYRFNGTVNVSANTIHYELSNTRVGLRYSLTWTVFPDRLEFACSRDGGSKFRAWHSAAWRMSFDSTIAATQIIAQAQKQGQSGSFNDPAILHAPNFGSLAMERGGEASARLEVFRPKDRIELELKTGERPTPEGDWELAQGHFESNWSFVISSPPSMLVDCAPRSAKEAIRHAAHTGLNFRADTATLSNNGASMHCPISMDTWSCQCTRMGELLPGLSSMDLLRQSLERWLDGGPGYAAGNLKQDGAIHSGEDEYLMTGTAALLGLAEYLSVCKTDEWLEKYAKPISHKISEMKKRDLDGDGLIESSYRTGVSGRHQWSTCWYDVISYGWKDAFSNALLYDALGYFKGRLGNTSLQNWLVEVEVWRAKIKANYCTTFFNPENQWLAGWVCKEGKQHDHAFLASNGAAAAAGLLPEIKARKAMEGLISEMNRLKVPSARLGLPGNLHPIPDSDLSDIIQGYPFGYYQNGGRTHAQARHFLRGLYAVGLVQEADTLLEELAEGMASGNVFGGCKSGVDWRYWDDRPCGYEGLLTDQFGVIGLILERYGK